VRPSPPRHFSTAPALKAEQEDGTQRPSGIEVVCPLAWRRQALAGGTRDLADVAALCWAGGRRSRVGRPVGPVGRPAAQGRAVPAIYATWAAVRTDVPRFRETVLAGTRPIMAAAAGVAAPSAEAAGRLEQSEVAGWVKWSYDADSPDRDGDRYVRELIAETKAHGPERVADQYYIDGREERVLTVGRELEDGQPVPGRDQLLHGGADVRVQVVPDDHERPPSCWWA
jgi:hypothetical protein